MILDFNIGKTLDVLVYILNDEFGCKEYRLYYEWHSYAGAIGREDEPFMVCHKPTEVLAAINSERKFY
jgi:hypothetical protein